MLKSFHTLSFLRMHNNLQPTGRNNEVSQQKHIKRCISAQINDSGKLKGTGNSTKTCQVIHNNKEQLMILASSGCGRIQVKKLWRLVFAQSAYSKLSANNS